MVNVECVEDDELSIDNMPEPDDEFACLKGGVSPYFKEIKDFLASKGITRATIKLIKK